MTALSALGLAWLVIGAPIAAVFLFRHEEKTGYLPPERDEVPLVYPQYELQQRDEAKR